MPVIFSNPLIKTRDIAQNIPQTPVHPPQSGLVCHRRKSLTAPGYTREEDPKWDKDFGAVGAIVIGQNPELLAGADPREETTALGK